MTFGPGKTITRAYAAVVRMMPRSLTVRQVVDRQLPSNPDLEWRYVEALVSHIRRPADVGAAMADVPTDAFTDPAMSAVFGVLGDLHRAGRLNLVDFSSECCAKVRDGYAVAGKLLKAYNPADLDTVAKWAGDLKRLAHRRRLAFSLDVAIDTALAGEVDPADLEAGLAAERTRNLATYGTERHPTMADALDAFDAHRRRFADADNALRFGFGAIDSRALWLPSYGLILGRTSHGKSALAVSMALNMARAGRHAVYYSLEQPTAQIVMRFLCILSRQTATEVMQNPDQTAVEWLRGAPLTIIDGRRTVEQIAGEALRLRRRGQCDAVFIDQMSRIQHIARRGENQEQAWTRTSGRVAELWQEIGVPVVLLAQLNAKDGKEHPAPSAAQVKNCGSMLEDADWVLVLDRLEADDARFQKQETARRKLESERAFSDADEADWRGRIGVVLAKDRLATMGGAWSVRLKIDKETGEVQ